MGKAQNNAYYYLKYLIYTLFFIAWFIVAIFGSIIKFFLRKYINDEQYPKRVKSKKKSFLKKRILN